MFGDETKRMLAHYKIPIGDVLDARGMETSQYKIQLKRQNKAVALSYAHLPKGSFFTIASQFGALPRVSASRPKLLEETQHPRLRLRCCVSKAGADKNWKRTDGQ